ncbi:MAG: hypothetical protein H6711_18085 [Myxococcales bacterium]|nr:hypothetical protein [Myxococcales bacterium]
MARPILRAVALLAPLLAAAPAAADEAPPPSNTVCDGKKAGDPCEFDGIKGACVTDTCSRLDYSGGVPPESVSYECLRCEEGAPSKPVPTKSDDVEETPGGEPAAVEPTPTEATSKGGCTIDARGGVASLLAIVFLGLAARRRG